MQASKILVALLALEIAVFSFTGTPFGQFVQESTKTGWVVGGGIEHMFAPHWTVRAEARYVNLGHSAVTCAPAANNPCPTGTTYRGEFSNSMVMGLLGVDFKF